MKTIIKSILGLGIILSFNSCNKDEELDISVTASIDKISLSAGEVARASSNVEGNEGNELTYQWQISIGNSWEDIEGEVQSSITFDYDKIVANPNINMPTNVKIPLRVNVECEGEVYTSNTINLTLISEVVYGSFTDTRDGKEYKTIEIGGETWFAENLDYEINGLEIISDTDWENNNAADGWCRHPDSQEGDKYGILYQYNAAMNACPDGWHVPSEEEWNQLIIAIGENPETYYNDAHPLTDTSVVSPEGDKGTNTTGFSALMGGYRDIPGIYDDWQIKGRWWSSTIVNGDVSVYDIDSHDDFGLFLDSQFDTRQGVAVRCVKDD